MRNRCVRTFRKRRTWFGIYSDPPWPDAGEEYLWRFTEQDHRDLAAILNRFERIRIVVRYGDHPLIRELYTPEDGWSWIECETRNQGNNAVKEALIVKRCGGPERPPFGCCLLIWNGDHT